MQTPLMLPGAIRHHLLIDLISGLSPHLHFKKKKAAYNQNRIQLGQVWGGVPILQINATEINPHTSPGASSTWSQRQAGSPGSRCPEPGSGVSGGAIFLGPAPYMHLS